MDYNGARFWGEYTLCKNSVARPIFKIFISNTEHIFNHIGWAMWNYLYFGSLMKMRRVTAWNSTFHTSCCHRNVLFILSGLLPFQLITAFFQRKIQRKKLAILLLQHIEAVHILKYIYHFNVPAAIFYPIHFALAKQHLL